MGGPILVRYGEQTYIAEFQPPMSSTRCDASFYALLAIRISTSGKDEPAIHMPLLDEDMCEATYCSGYGCRHRHYYTIVVLCVRVGRHFYGFYYRVQSDNETKNCYVQKIPLAHSNLRLIQSTTHSLNSCRQS